jgi:hypothetical protein
MLKALRWWHSVGGEDGSDCVGFEDREDEEWGHKMSVREGNCNAETVYTLC